MSVRVITVAPTPPMLADPLIDRYDTAALPAPGPARDSFLTEHAETIEVAVANAGGGVDAALMDRLPNLRLIAHYAVGYDSTDAAAATERGITISNTPDVLTDCTADLAVGLTIDTMRRITSGDRFIRAGRWGSTAFPLARRLTGAQVGILGLGRIGTAIAQRLTGFNCEIRYHSRRPVAEVPYDHVDSPISLAQAVEVLIVVVPGGPATENLVGAEMLRALGPRGYLINIARGSVVDQEALVTALTDGTIAGAGLDVFRDEPRVPPALWDLDNVVLAPHIGSATEETRQEMADLVLANVDSWFRTGTAVTPV